MILLDTHAWIWWIASPSRLSDKAKRTIDDVSESSVLLVSSISCWEVAKLVSKGRVAFSIDVGEWIDRCLRLPYVQIVPMEPEIAVLSTRLPGSPPRDPADQIILATALHQKVPLITKDRLMRKYSHVVTIW